MVRVRGSRVVRNRNVLDGLPGATCSHRGITPLSTRSQTARPAIIFLGAPYVVVHYISSLQVSARRYVINKKTCLAGVRIS